MIPSWRSISEVTRTLLHLWTSVQIWPSWVSSFTWGKMVVDVLNLLAVQKYTHDLYYFYLHVIYSFYIHGSYNFYVHGSYYFYTHEYKSTPWMCYKNLNRLRTEGMTCVSNMATSSAVISRNAHILWGKDERDLTEFWSCIHISWTWHTSLTTSWKY